MPIPTVSIAAQLPGNLATSESIVATADLRVRGLSVLVPAATPTTLDYAVLKQPKRRRAQRDVAAFKVAGLATSASNAPTITDISPSSVADGTGATITVTGTGFEVGADITLIPVGGGTPVAVANVVRVGATSMTFEVPDTIVAGNYNVRVSDTQAAVVSSQTLTVTTAASIASFAPASVPNDNATQVTITGAGFEEGATVTLDDGVGTFAATVVSVAAAEIVFTVPGTVAAADYDVIVSDSDGAVTAATQLTVTAA